MRACDRPTLEPSPRQILAPPGRSWSWSWSSSRSALAAYDARRDAAHQRHATRALAVAARRRRLARGPRRRCGRPDPTRALQPYAEQVRARHRHRLRRGDGPDRHPLHPPRPGPDRPAVRRRPSAARPRAGRSPRTYTGTLGPVDARGGARCDDGGTASSRWSRSASPQRASSERARRRPAADRCSAGASRARASGWPAPGWSAAGCGARPTGSAPRELTPDVRVLRRGPARRPRGAAAGRRASGRVQLVNDEARRLLDLPDDGRPAASTTSACRRRWCGRARRRPPRPDEIHLTDERVLVVNRRPRAGRAATVGTVVTLRDHTELQAVTGELDVVRGLTESLRSQTHEAANRLHTVVSLIELGRTEEAVDFATEELAGRPAAHRPGGRRGRRAGARRAAARQDRPGRRARHRADRRPASTRRRRPASQPARPGHGRRQPRRQRPRRRGRGGRERRVRGRARRRRDGTFAIAVGDSGPGLPAEDARARPRARLVHQGRRRRRPRARPRPGRPGRRAGTAARSTSARRRSAARSSP